MVCQIAKIRRVSDQMNLFDGAGWPSPERRAMEKVERESRPILHPQLIVEEAERWDGLS
jgi:hypothetical protein